MSNLRTIEEIVAQLKRLHAQSVAGDPKVAEITSILTARDEVLAQFQPMFAADRLAQLTEADFRDFLMWRHNKHWKSLQRMGPAICADMPRLRTALSILLDESRPIADRLDELVPTSGSAFVPRLSKAVLTPILLVTHPDRYGVWNQVSEAAMRTVGLWPDFERGTPFGQRYARVNEILNEVAAGVGVDLWSLDALWWQLESVASEPDDAELEGALADHVAEMSRPYGEATFGLERHLQEFLRDNWDHTELGPDWKLHEEDGDPEAGYEYPCEVGRIDLLAHHRREPRWLIIELKRRQSSDQTVGQVLRYMGWVEEHLAEPRDRVEGLVIAHRDDASIRYALKMVQDVHVKLYEVEFRLREGATK